MPVREYVHPADTLTAEQLNQFVSQQPLVFADNTARDAAVVARPESVLGTSPSFTPAANVQLPPTGGTFDTGVGSGNEWTVTVAGRVWTIRRVRNYRAGVRMELAASDKPNDAVFEQALVDNGVWIRQVDTADPANNVSAQFTPNPNPTGIWAFIINRYAHTMNMTAGRSYRYEFYVPAVPDPVRNGVLGLVLATDDWFIFNGGRWNPLTSPPPRRKALNPASAVVFPRREMSWESPPAAVDGRSLWSNMLTGRIPAGGSPVTPFTGELTDSPVEYRNGWTHIVTDTRSVVITADCQLQIAAVGPGGAGQSYTSPHPTDDHDDSHIFGGGGGGAGGLVSGVFNARKGDQLTVNGATGYVALAGRAILRAPRGSAGGENTAGYGCGGGGSAVNQSAEATTTVAETGGPVLELPADNYLGLKNAAGSDAGPSRVTSPGVWTARAGNGGSLPSTLIPWIPGGVVVGGGGQGGTHLRPGRAGAGYGGGAGGAGGGAFGTIRPSAPTVVYTTYPRRSGGPGWAVSLTIGTPANADETRYRLHWSTSETPGAPSSGWQWENWTAWRESHQTTLATEARYRTLVVEAQSRKRQTDGSYQTNTNFPGEFIDITPDLPSGLSVAISTEGNPANVIVLRFDGRGVNWRNSGDDIQGVEGVRFQVEPYFTRPVPGAWYPTQTTTPLYNRLRNYRIPILPTYNTLLVFAQASNSVGQTVGRVIATWNRNDPVRPPEPVTDPDAPDTPTVSLVYNDQTSQIAASWEAARATEYQFRWIQTDREGTEAVGPGSGDGWSAWSGTAQTWTARISATVSQFAVEVRARNRKQDGTYQTSTSGRASRSFAAETPSGAVVPPASPNPTVTSFTGGRLTVSWPQAARADSYRVRTALTRNSGSSSTSAWGAWGTATTAIISIPGDVRSARVEVQARNGVEPDYSYSSGFASWWRQTTPSAPRKPTVSISNVNEDTNGRIGFTLSVRASGASGYRYRVLAGTRPVIAWTARSSSGQYQIRLTSAASDRIRTATLTVEAQAWNLVGWGQIEQTTFNPSGNVGAVVFSPPPVLESVQGNEQVVFSFEAAGATQYRWAFGDGTGRYSEWAADWTATRQARLRIPQTTSTVDLRVQARSSSAHVPRTGQIRWTRTARPAPSPVTPSPEAAPSGVRVRLTVTANTWRASWSARGDNLRYQYTLSFGYPDGRTSTRPAQTVGSRTSVSGGLPPGADRVSVAVVAYNQSGRPASGEASAPIDITPVIVDLSVTPYAGHPTAVISMRSRNAGEVRYQITSRPAGSSIPSGGLSSLFAAPSSGGFSSWTVPNFYTATTTGSVVVVGYARTRGRTVSTTRTVAVRARPQRLMSRQAPPPAPTYRTAPPPVLPPQQQRSGSYPGEAAKPGVVVVRHSLFGLPLTRLRV